MKYCMTSVNMKANSAYICNRYNTKRGYKLEVEHIKVVNKRVNLKNKSICNK